MTTIHNYVAVIGRMCGDDEDTCLMFECVTYDGAIQAFTDAMWAYERMAPDELAEAKELAEANGEGVYINHVLTSTAPIVQE